MLQPGDRVEIINGPHNTSLVGRTATVLRKGFGCYWIKLDGGVEKVWKRAWLKKIEVKDAASN